MGAAIEVHRYWGTGLIENLYAADAVPGGTADEF
jgi:hypothetical protein